MVFVIHVYDVSGGGVAVTEAVQLTSAGLT